MITVMEKLNFFFGQMHVYGLLLHDHCPCKGVNK